MFLKAGAVSLALLLASRVLGLLRESAQAAAFGTSGLADLAVLMLTLPDWLVGVLASGAMAYVLLPAWAEQTSAQVSRAQHRVALGVLGAGGVAAVLLLAFGVPALGWLAPGLPQPLAAAGTQAMAWSGVAIPLAALAALWATRLQHERDFIGMYGAGLLVNLLLVAAIAVAGSRQPAHHAVAALGAGLLLAMAVRLLWLGLRQRRLAAPAPPPAAAADPAALPPARVWLWAALSAGLPLALPFVARSAASQTGEGALATFNYAWKLVELPLILAIQLVATLALPAVARALAQPSQAPDLAPLRAAFALAWTAACACVAALLVGAPSLARILFGWGRMPPQVLDEVARWAATASWGLLAQALVAVTLTVLAAQRRLHVAAWAHGAALLVLLAAVAAGVRGGQALMVVLNVVATGVALACLLAMGRLGWSSLPWRSFGCAGAALAGVALAKATGLGSPGATDLATGLGLAAAAALLVGVLSWFGAPDLRRALGR